ncbi:MAG: hypothetical protein HYT65_01895 [Candidatus Yanofskybacteria bacterium]|nr:hypothetical protein [Candidatus Yanofskybacteria bacterium]
MAKIYVAGKNLARARLLMDMLRGRGHEITYDWATSFSAENPNEKAVEELEAVRKADMVIYLWEFDQESARYEAGMAMGLGKPIIVSGGPNSFFFKLPDVYCVERDNQIMEVVSDIIKNPNNTLLCP